MKNTFLALAALIGLMVTFTGSAQAYDKHHGHGGHNNGHNSRNWHHTPPRHKVYYRPVYYRTSYYPYYYVVQEPVFYQPAPVIYRSAPVIMAPQPATYGFVMHIR
jgi:hypothetical protein